MNPPTHLVAENQGVIRRTAVSHDRLLDTDDLYRRRLQQQIDRQIQQAPDLADRSHLQAKLLGLLGSLSGSLARSEPLGPVLAETLHGVLNLAGTTQGALMVQLEPADRPVVIAVGFRPHEVRLVQAFLEDRPAVARAGSGPADRSRRLVAQLTNVGSVTCAPLHFGGARPGILLLASSSLCTEDSWQAYTALNAAQIGQALSLGQALGQRGASEQRYRAVMENANDGIFVLSRDGVILESNAQGAALLQRPGEGVVGRLFADFLVAEESEGDRRRFVALLSEGNLQAQHVAFQRPGGETVEIDVSARAAELDGQPAVIATTHDVTERIHLEAQLCQWQKMDAMGRLAASVSHDFNNILAVVLAHACILLRELPEDDARRENAIGIKAGADRGAALVRQLLDFTRMADRSLGGVSVNPTIHALLPLLRRLLTPMVLIETSLDAGPGDIAGDAAQFEQVVMNLAVNAGDAMPGGGRLHLSTADMDLQGEVAQSGQRMPDGRYVLLSVRDTGAGMDLATQKRIFEPFFTTKPPGLGTGLGLSTCQMIVNRCHGFMAVDSAPGTGTTFRCYFPRPLDSGAAPQPTAGRS
jgi:PAS domain S-box-containing protein